MLLKILKNQHFTVIKNNLRNAEILPRNIFGVLLKVRRALHRLQDMLAMVDKNLILLQQNCGSVAEEVDEIDRRLAKALKDRTEYLRQELDRYLSTEVRNLTQLKENLEVKFKDGRGFSYRSVESGKH